MTNLSRFSIFITGLFLFLAVASHKSYSQTLDQYVSADSLEAGDLFHFSITLKKDQDYDDIIYPDSSDFTTDDIELRSRKKFRVADFKDSLRYQLQFWATQSATIPALPVKLVLNKDTTTIYTKPVQIGFTSVLRGNKKKEKLRPLKPIFNFAAAWWPYIVGFITLLLAAALIYYLYQKYKAQPEPEPKPTFTPRPFLNPLKELENNLRQLRDISLNSKKHFEQYYISLGNAIRLYFEQMYSILALESTSREIIIELNKRAIDHRLIEQTRIVLRDADMVKFANFTPTEIQTRETYAKAEEFLTIARELHSERIRQMKKHHQSKVEQARQAFNENQTEEEQS